MERSKWPWRISGAVFLASSVFLGCQTGGDGDGTGDDKAKIDSLKAKYGNPACCEFATGDILREDLLEIESCLKLDQGRPIKVDPMRLTPHPCCPHAKGERCGG